MALCVGSCEISLYFPIRSGWLETKDKPATSSYECSRKCWCHAWPLGILLQDGLLPQLSVPAIDKTRPSSLWKKARWSRWRETLEVGRRNVRLSNGGGQHFLGEQKSVPWAPFQHPTCCSFLKVPGRQTRTSTFMKVRSSAHWYIFIITLISLATGCFVSRLAKGCSAPDQQVHQPQIFGKSKSSRSLGCSATPFGDSHIPRASEHVWLKLLTPWTWNDFRMCPVNAGILPYIAWMDWQFRFYSIQSLPRGECPASGGG